MKNLLVIGSGVSGMTAALKLAQAGHKVTVWSREASTVFADSSFNAYAMWWPVADPAQPRLEPWADVTYARLSALAQDPTTGVQMRKIFSLQTSTGKPWFAKLPFFRNAQPGEISAEYADAFVLDQAPVVDPEVHLPWLRKQLELAGVSFEQRTVDNLTDCPGQFDALINCTSLGARKLVGDASLYPSRFQVVKIKHNGFDRVVFDDGGPNSRACIVPHKDYIKLGAVVDEHIETTEIDDAATVDILRRCCKMVPGFKADLSDVLKVTRAFRPERATVRVEPEIVGNRLVVHNYGHDGMGYILAIGIAEEIVALLR
jgi:D-amino-acid oxidase